MTSYLMPKFFISLKSYIRKSLYEYVRNYIMGNLANLEPTHETIIVTINVVSFHNFIRDQVVVQKILNIKLGYKLECF